MTAANVMSIKDMIKLSFRDNDTDTVNFNLIRSLLHLFARQLKVLERKVEVKLEAPYNTDVVVSNIKVTEVKIHAKNPDLHHKHKYCSGKRITKTKYPKLRYQISSKKRHRPNKHSLETALSSNTRALKFSEDVYFDPHRKTEKSNFPNSPSFVDCKHFTSTLSLNNSTATSNTMLGDDVNSEKSISLESKYSVHVSEDQIERKKSVDTNKHGKLLQRKASQVKSLDTLLYKVSTKATLFEKHTSTRDKAVIIHEPIVPKYIIKEMPYNTVEPLALTKKIVIIKKVRKRILSKHKPKATDDSSGSEVYVSDNHSDDHTDIEKYRLSTEPYLGEDFVPIDLSKKPSDEEEENARKRLLKTGKMTAHDKQLVNKDSNQENLSKFVDSYDVKSLRDDANKVGDETGSDNYNLDKLSNKDMRHQLGTDFDANADQSKFGSATKRSSIDIDNLGTETTTGEQYNTDGYQESFKKRTQRLSKDVDQVDQGFNADVDIHKSSKGTKFSSKDIDQSGTEFYLDADHDKVGMGTIFSSKGTEKLEKGIDAISKQDQFSKSAHKSGEDNGQLNAGSDVDADQKPEKESKLKDTDKVKQGESSILKDTDKLGKGIEVGFDQYKLDKERGAPSEDADKDKIGYGINSDFDQSRLDKSLRLSSKDALSIGTRAKDRGQSSEVSGHDAFNRLRNQRLSSDPNTIKYKVKTGKTPETLRERIIIIVDKSPPEIEFGQSSKLPFITREEFEKLEFEFLDIQQSMHSIVHKDWRDQKLIEAIGKSTSSTNAMAALQLSASLEETEKKVEAMTDILVSLAQRHPGSIDNSELNGLLKSVTKIKQLHMARNGKDLAGKDWAGKEPASKELAGKDSADKKSAKEPPIKEPNEKTTVKETAGKDSTSIEVAGKKTAGGESTGIKLTVTAGKNFTSKELASKEPDDWQTKLHIVTKTSEDVEKDEAKEPQQRVISTSETDKTTEIGGYPIKSRETTHEDNMEETTRLTGTTSASGGEVSAGFRGPSRISYTFNAVAKQSLEKPGTESISGLQITNFITHEELNNAMDNLTILIQKEIASGKKRSADVISDAMKRINEYEKTLTTATNIMAFLQSVNSLIANFAKSVNKIERDILRTMTVYMEDLMQMQFNLEHHMELMAEALANVRGDPDEPCRIQFSPVVNTKRSNSECDNVIKCLHINARDCTQNVLTGDSLETIADFSKDINMFSEKRKALRDSQIEAEIEQTRIACRLEKLRKLVLKLECDKYERTNLATSLENLVNVCDLNTLIPFDTFNSNWNDIDRKIFKAFSSFDGAEQSWQHENYNIFFVFTQLPINVHDHLTPKVHPFSIDVLTCHVGGYLLEDPKTEDIIHLVQQFNGKANSMEITLLRNNIQMHCNNLAAKIKELSTIVKHCRIDPDKRILIRHSNCLSCYTKPAAEKFRHKREKGGDNKAHNSIGKENYLYVRPCYPGEPIKHAMDPRSQFCPRFCGGDTKKDNLCEIQIIPRQHKCACGDDKSNSLKKPCKICNVKSSTCIK